MNKPTSVPHRFSESQFKFYAPYIALALKEFPACIKLSPADVKLSVETFAARFRDAMTAKEEYGYKHPDINETDFDEKHKYLYVSIPIGTGIVLIGSRAAVKAAQQPGATTAEVSVKTTPQATEIVVKNEPGYIEMVCSLLGNNVLTPKPRFVVFGMEEISFFKTKLESDYDISIVQDPVERGKFHIL